MLKKRLLTALPWLIAVILTVGTVIAVAREQHRAREEYQAQSEAECTALASSPEEKHACAKEAQARKDYTQWWYVLVAWPEGITVWAIIVTGIFIAWQSNETRESAIAMKESIRLQENGMRQWVEVEPDGLFTQTEEGQPDPPTIVTIHPRWRIVNNTSLPLTLTSVEVKIAIDEGWKSYVFSFSEEVIPPAKNANFRSIFVPFKLNTQETTEFLRDGIELSIAIMASFVGANGRVESQYWGDMYFCKIGTLEINFPIGKGPQREYIEKDDRPSTLVLEKGVRYLEDPKPGNRNPN